MKKLPFLALAALFSLLSHAIGLLGQVPLPYTVDFEANQGFVLGPLDGQDGWTELSGNSAVSDAVAYSGTNALVLEGGVPVSSVSQVFQELVDEPIIFIDFYIRPVADTDPALGTKADTSYGRIRFAKSGSEGIFQALDGDGVGGGRWINAVSGVTLDPDDRTSDWKRVTMRIDLSLNLWDLYLDGNLVLYDLGGVDASVLYLSEIVFTGHSTSDGYVDFGYAGAANPLFVDADNDGMEDSWESANGLDPQQDDRLGDPDGDGLANIDEYYVGTDPGDGDSDDDGLDDGAEISTGRDPAVFEEDSFLFALGSMRLFLKADSGAISDGNGKIQTWQDQSGNSNHAAQSFASWRPLLVADAIGGQPALRFDSLDDYLQLPDVMSGAGSGEIFAVVKAGADAASGDHRGLWRFATQNASYEGKGVYPSTSGEVQESFGRSAPVNIGNPGFPLNQPNLYNVSSASSDWVARMNGVVQATTSANSPGFRSNPRIGQGSSYYATSFDGDISEVLVFDRVLTVDERNAIGVYAGLKYGIQELLPPPSLNAVASPVTATKAQISWDGDLGGVTFEVERKQLGGTWSLIASVSERYGFLDENLVPGSEYVYRVRAVKSGLSSAYSAESSIQTYSHTSLEIPTTGMRLWLTGDSVAQVAGKVGVWEDRSGRSNDASQSSANYRPAIVSNAINGHSAVRFDGTLEYLNLPDVMQGSQAGEAYVVLKAAFDVAPGGGQYFYGYGLWRFAATGASSEGDSRFPDTSGGVRESFGRSGNIYLGNLDEPLDQPNLYCVASTQSEWSVSLNGVNQYFAGTNNFGFRSDPVIGVGSSYYVDSFNGDIAEIIIFDHKLSSEERNGLHFYLRNKYDLSVEPFRLADNDPTGDLDGDGVSNSEEVYVYLSDAGNADSDGDGMSDGYEASFGLNLILDDTDLDLDGDGVSNYEEFIVGRNPTAGAILDNSTIELDVYYAK